MRTPAGRRPPGPEGGTSSGFSRRARSCRRQPAPRVLLDELAAPALVQPVEREVLRAVPQATARGIDRKGHLRPVCHRHHRERAGEREQVGQASSRRAARAHASPRIALVQEQARMCAPARSTPKRRPCSVTGRPPGRRLAQGQCVARQRFLRAGLLPMPADHRAARPDPCADSRPAAAQARDRLFQGQRFVPAHRPQPGTVDVDRRRESRDLAAVDGAPAVGHLRRPAAAAVPAQRLVTRQVASRRAPRRTTAAAARAPARPRPASAPRRSAGTGGRRVRAAVVGVAEDGDAAERRVAPDLVAAAARDLRRVAGHRPTGPGIRPRGGRRCARDCRPAGRRGSRIAGRPTSRAVDRRQEFVGLERRILFVHALRAARRCRDGAPATARRWCRHPGARRRRSPDPGAASATRRRPVPRDVRRAWPARGLVDGQPVLIR